VETPKSSPSGTSRGYGSLAHGCGFIPTTSREQSQGVAGRQSSSLAKQHPATYTMFRNATLYVNMESYLYML